jgi:hypothetical protein
VNTAIQMAGLEVGLFRDKSEVRVKLNYDDLSDDELLIWLRVGVPAPLGIGVRSTCYWTETESKGRAKLSSWPSGSIRWKKRSPHSASRGTVAGWYPAPSALS